MLRGFLRKAWLRSRLRAVAPAGAMLLLAAFFGLAAPPSVARGVEGAELRSEVKAGFLYNFLKFAEWPQAEGGAAPRQVTIAVLGDERLAGVAAAALAGKTARGLPLRVVPLSGVDDLRRELAGVHLLFLGAVSDAQEEAVLALACCRPVLTVGESPGFCGRGGMIALVQDEERLRFEINQDAARRSGLRLSSKLLGLARRVYAGGGP